MQRLRHFKVHRGFGQEDYIPIDETELEKALYAHITGKPVVFQNGSINGTHISAIMPDINRTLGWNEAHKLDADDWNDIHNRGTDRELRYCMALTKERVQLLISTGREHLIGQNVPLPELEAPREQRLLSQN